MGHHRQTVFICMIVLLECQIWSAVAYNNQQSKWVVKHMSQFGEGSRVVSRPDRHLEEYTSRTTTGKPGYRAALVDEDHKYHNRYNLSPIERIRHSAERSLSRALGLDSRARAASYHSSGKDGSTGRKALQVAVSSFEESVQATPGSYSMTFSLGTPPQQFIAIADTGSDLVWIQCAACTVCFNSSSPLFQPAASSTYASLGCSGACNVLGQFLLQCSPNCKYTYAYGDQSSTLGDFSADTVTLGDFNGTGTTLIPGFKFGCGLQNKGRFSGVDGIVGLARGRISFPSQIAPYLNNAIKFSYCLTGKFQSNATGASPIIFGEAAVPTNVSAVLYTPMLTPYNVSRVPYYYVNLQSISVGGANLTIPASAFQINSNGSGGGTIFDSGTTYTLLTSTAYFAVADAFTQILGLIYPTVDLSLLTGLSVCFDISTAVQTGAQIEVPVLVFSFENADLVLPPENTMVLLSDGSSAYMCLALMLSPGMNIIGNWQQQNFQIVYEEDALQIGWLPLDCTTL